MREMGLKESQIAAQRAVSRVVDVYVEENGSQKHVLHKDGPVVTADELVSALRPHF